MGVNMNNKILFVLCLIMTLQACSTLNRYQSTSKISMIGDDQKYTAILFYAHLTGHTWYGGELDNKASDVRLRICKNGVMTKIFSEDKLNKSLELRSKARDLQTHQLDDKGNLVTIDPTLLQANQSCGEIWVNNKEALVQHLSEGSTPKMHIKCKSLSLIHI